MKYIIGGAISLPIIAAHVLWGAFAVSLLWGWFAVPIFGLPAISIAQAVGLVTLAHLFCPYSGSTMKNPSDVTDWAAIFAALFGRYAAALGIGWVATFFL